VILGKPNVYGSIFRFDGQASVFDASSGPCYRCLFPEPPPPGLVPSCAEGGVLGVLPGTIGAIQATETIKILLGRGTTLSGRLLLYDALEMSFDEVRLRKDPDCPVCGSNPTITSLIDYEEFCDMPAHEQSEYQGQQELAAQGLAEIGPLELKRWLDDDRRIALLDVREPYEWQISNLGSLGAELVPLSKVLERMGDIDGATDVVVYCRSGVRSARAIGQLREHGFTRLFNLSGGINRYAREVDSTLPIY